MKELIERMTLRRRGYLAEATFNLDRDVTHIYEKSGLKDVVEAVRSKDKRKMEDVFSRFLRNRNMPFFWMPSSKLRSRVAQQASKVSPVKVEVGLFSSGSYYSPAADVVRISLNDSAVHALKAGHFIPDVVIQMLGGQAKAFWSEFSAEAIKGTIYHELAHWADDVLHGRFIAKGLKRAQEKGTGREAGFGRYAKVTHTPMEFNAQVHSLKAMRKQIGKQAFDRMSWIEMFTRKSSLASNFRGYRDEAEYEVAMKRFVKRLHREGLLGKKLKKIPSWKSMQVYTTVVPGK